MISCAMIKAPTLVRRNPLLKLAHLGTFDVENYGDLLFPLILERRLSGFCDEFVHVSPAGGPPPWDDCVETVSFSQFSHEASIVDGLIVGGGQIIRATPTPLEVYNAGGISAFLAYPSLWLGASNIASRENVPLCWNAPGVSAGFAPVTAQLVRWAASVTDRLAVRDEASRRSLQQAGVENSIDVVPDTAIEVSGLWTKEETLEAYENSFFRRNRSVPERAVVCHVNSRWAREDLVAIAARIDRICLRLGATAILVAIGPVHGDGKVQRAVARGMDTEPLLIDRPRSLREVAACIAHSDAYLGSSLHGLITACSFGTRGMIIASEEDAKYSGFLQHFGLSSWLVKSWEEAEQRIDGLMNTPAEVWESIPEAAGPILDGHWSHTRSILASRDQATAGTPQEAGNKRAECGRLGSIGKDRYGDIEPFKAFIAESLQINYAQLQRMRRRLTEMDRSLGEQRRRIEQERHELRKLRQKLRETHAEIREKRQSLEIAKTETARLVDWIQELDEGISALSSSRQWKPPRAFAQLCRKALREPDTVTSIEHLKAVLEQFRAWRTERSSWADDSHSGN
jgi:polysaccharide pyruvyl transferase WcaK-like protein